MEREEIKGFLLGISVGVGVGYYLLKPAASKTKEQDPSVDRKLNQNPAQNPPKVVPN